MKHDTKIEKGYGLQQLLLWMLFVCISLPLSAQTIDPKPDPPVFKSISPDLSTGVITLRWDRSPSPDSLIKGYIIYKLEKDNLGNISFNSIDTVDANTFTYIDPTVDANSKQESYKMATKGKTEPSKLTDPHKTMWVTTQYDSCKATLNIKWTRYIGWGNRVKRYEIYAITGNQAFNAGALQKIGSTPYTDTTFAFTPAVENEHYHYAVKAINENDEAVISWSNHTYKFTQMPIAPTTMVFDSLLSSNQTVRLRYTIDSQTGVSNFEIFRSENIFGIFTSAHIFTDKLENEYTNSGLARGKTYYYYIIARNACNNIVAKSDTARSEIVSIRNEGETNYLSWPDYPKSSGSVSYSVWRKSSIDPTFVEIAGNITTEAYTDDVTSLFGQNVTPEVCYRIEAKWQKDNLQTVSQSQISCVSLVPDIQMPNAIDPLSESVNPNTNKRRNRFEPITGFAVDFSLQVFDRNGRILYDGNAGWDGRINQGEFVKPGSYIYILKVTLPSGKVLEKSGNVNVVYSKM